MYHLLIRLLAIAAYCAVQTGAACPPTFNRDEVLTTQTDACREGIEKCVMPQNTSEVNGVLTAIAPEGCCLWGPDNNLRSDRKYKLGEITVDLKGAKILPETCLKSSGSGSSGCIGAGTSCQGVTVRRMIESSGHTYRFTNAFSSAIVQCAHISTSSRVCLTPNHLIRVDGEIRTWAKFVEEKSISTWNSKQQTANFRARMETDHIDCAGIHILQGVEGDVISRYGVKDGLIRNAISFLTRF
jgi:hypothetical protein